MLMRSRSSDTDSSKLTRTQAPPVPEQLPPPVEEQLPPHVQEQLSPPVAEQLTIAIIAKARSDLRQTHERSRLSITDIINRAISFFEFVDAEQHAGSELILRRASGEKYVVKLL